MTVLSNEILYILKIYDIIVVDVVILKIKIRNLDINYIQYGSGSDILLLHGWGQNIEMMRPLGDNLCSNHRITIVDFPGFGLSSEPDYPWSISDYVLFLEEFIKEVGIKKPTIMGHSFGGRVSIAYSADHAIEKLVLFGSPCIRNDSHVPLSVKILKSLKKIPGMNGISEIMKKYIGSDDYKAASPMMRKVLVNVVNEDLSNYAKKIEEPTLLIWGDKDTAAPVEDARVLEKIMIDAALIVLPGTHYVYLECLPQVIRILESFI